MGTRQGFVRALDGQRLHWAGWGLDVPAERPTVVLVHGYGEHIKRYEELAAYLVDEGGLAVVGVDVRGHGQSSGDRGHVDRYDAYLVDVAAAFDVAHRLRPEGKRVLLGHSNGGLIALRYALSECGRRPDALVLSGPLLKLALTVPKWKATLGSGLSKVIPAMSMPNDLSADFLSHDKAVVDAYINDPMVHRVATARYFTEMTAAREDALVRAPKLRLPTLVMQGGEDRIVSPEGARELIDRLKHDDVTYIEYQGLYHEIFNELERAKVFADVGGWLSERGFWAGDADDVAPQQESEEDDSDDAVTSEEGDSVASEEGDTEAVAEAAPEAAPETDAEPADDTAAPDDAEDAAEAVEAIQTGADPLLATSASGWMDDDAGDDDMGLDLVTSSDAIAASEDDEAAVAEDEAAAAEDEAAVGEDEAAAAEDEAAAAEDEAAAAEDEAAAAEDEAAAAQDEEAAAADEADAASDDDEGDDG